MTKKLNLTPNVSLTAIEAEVAKLEPFQIALSNSKVVTIASPYDFRLSERAEVLDLYQRVQRGDADDMDLLKRLMSKADYKAYLAEDVTLAVHTQLLTMAMAYFEQGVKGTAGESDASAA